MNLIPNITRVIINNVNYLVDSITPEGVFVRGEQWNRRTRSVVKLGPFSLDKVRLSVTQLPADPHNHFTNCPCGKKIRVPFDPEIGMFEVCNLRCECRKYHSTGGNTVSGEVSCWISERDAWKAEMEYQNQMMQSEIREMWLAEEEY